MSIQTTNNQKCIRPTSVLNADDADDVDDANDREDNRGMFTHVNSNVQNVYKSCSQSFTDTLFFSFLHSQGLTGP